jgi:hypothetical protein
MSHDAENRNSCVTAKKGPNPAPSNNGGSMAAARSGCSAEISLVPEKYDMGPMVTSKERAVKQRETLEPPSRIQDTRSILQEDTPLSSFVASPCDRPASPAGHTLHSSPTLPLPHHFAPKSQCDITQERGYFIKTPAGRQLWIPHSESDPIATSVAPSPLSSPSSTASTSETYPPTPPLPFIATLRFCLSSSRLSTRSSFHLQVHQTGGLLLLPLLPFRYCAQQGRP